MRITILDGAQVALLSDRRSLWRFQPCCVKLLFVSEPLDIDIAQWTYGSLLCKLRKAEAWALKV